MERCAIAGSFDLGLGGIARQTNIHIKIKALALDKVSGLPSPPTINLCHLTSFPSCDAISTDVNPGLRSVVFDNLSKLNRNRSKSSLVLRDACGKKHR